jgi:hypothetical protein
MNPTPAPDKLLALARELLEKTRNGLIKWKPDAALASFAIRTRRGSVVVGSRDGDGQEPFTLTVLNPEGQAIEALVSEWWKIDPDFGPREPAPWNDLLADLYRTARANAVDLEGIIDGILAEVENPSDEEPDFPSSASDDDIPF